MIYNKILFFMAVSLIPVTFICAVISWAKDSNTAALGWAIGGIFVLFFANNAGNSLAMLELDDILTTPTTPDEDEEPWPKK